jgi:hypothetical protein
VEFSRAELIRVIKAVVRTAFPILNQRLAPAKGRVVAAYTAAGRAGTIGVHTVDVQLLDAAGQPVGRVVPHLTVPTWWVGPGRGILCSPPVGSLVRVGWYESGEPFLDAVLPDGHDLPGQELGALTILHPAAKIQIDLAGNVLLQSTSGGIRLEAQTVTVTGNLVVTGQINP